jgi:ATP-dependent RNA helicase DDX51/DBP6
MFQVSRYDPKTTESDGKRRKKPNRRSRPKKRNRQDDSKQDENANESVEREQSDEDNDHAHTRGDHDDDDEHMSNANKSSLHVIAPEATGKGVSKGITSKQQGSAKTEEEAFDDMDLLALEESIDASSAATTNTEYPVDVSKATSEELQAALRLSKLPIQQAATGWRIAPFLVQNLERDGFDSFFPIQALVIPDVIASERHAHIRAQDICVTAPTGSGKTLSYVLPILNSLAGRQVRRLRALVVLPSRDLANQVYKVFQSFVKGSDLKVGLAIGQSDFEAEKMALTLDPDSTGADTAQQRLLFDPGNLDLALQTYQHTMSSASLQHDEAPSGRDGCTVDILVCTPGRLVDHLDNTPGFTLQHLRFMVVDEADRLLSQSYHNWIDRVIDATRSASVAAWREIIANDNKLPPLQVAPDHGSFVVEPITWRRGGAMGDDSEFNNNDSYFAPAASVCRPVQLRKMLVSATLTRDPQKLAALRLVNPKHFDVHQLTPTGDRGSNKYSMPDGLEEYSVECTAEQKPIVLLALLLEKLQTKGDIALTDKNLIVIFTQSVDSTHRLARLLQLLWATAGYGKPSAVVEFSSALNQSERSLLMTRCNDPADDVSIVVCSDGMSRGMDLEYISAVINYDVPSFAKTYVHRCGRTARAGKKGAAISLLKGGQVVQFAKMRQLIQAPDNVQSKGIQKHLVRDAVPKYRQSVQALKDVLDAEENGELSNTEVLSQDYMPEQ